MHSKAEDFSCWIFFLFLFKCSRFLNINVLIYCSNYLSILQRLYGEVVTTFYSIPAWSIQLHSVFIAL